MFTLEITSNAASQMNHRGTGDVYSTHFAQKSVLTPDPPSRQTVHNVVDQREETISLEATPKILTKKYEYYVIASISTKMN